MMIETKTKAADNNMLRAIVATSFDAATLTWQILRTTLLYSAVSLGVITFFWTDVLVNAPMESKVYLASRVFLVSSLVAGVVCVLFGRSMRPIGRTDFER